MESIELGVVPAVVLVLALLFLCLGMNPKSPWGWLGALCIVVAVSFGVFGLNTPEDVELAFKSEEG